MDATSRASKTNSMAKPGVKGANKAAEMFSSACSEDAASVTVPISQSAAVEAVTDADVSALRRVWTARLSKAPCLETVSNQSFLRFGCAVLAIHAGHRRRAMAKDTSYDSSTASVMNAASLLIPRVTPSPLELI